jgi:hypothetical protein
MDFGAAVVWLGEGVWRCAVWQGLAHRGDVVFQVSSAAWAGGATCGRAQRGDVAGWGNVVGQGHSGLRAMAVVLQRAREGQCGAPCGDEKGGGGIPGV